MLLNCLLTAWRSVLFIVLMPLSALLSSASRRFNTVTAGITSAAVEVAELIFLVNSSKGSNTVTVFSSKLHSLADNVAGMV